MSAFIKYDDGAKTLTFDVVTSETQEFSTAITEHPVEKGSNIADHIRQELTNVRLEVFVSNAPINNPKFSRQSVDLPVKEFSPPLAPTPGSIFGALGSLISSLLSGKKEWKAQVYKTSKEENFVADALDTLRQIQTKGTLCDIYTSSRNHKSMLLVRVEPNGNAGTGTGRSLTLEFRQFREVATKLVAAPKSTETRGKTIEKKGAQAPTEVPAAKKSVLKALAGGIGG